MVGCVGCNSCWNLYAIIINFDLNNCFIYRLFHRARTQIARKCLSIFPLRSHWPNAHQKSKQLRSICWWRGFVKLNYRKRVWFQQVSVCRINFMVNSQWAQAIDVLGWRGAFASPLGWWNTQAQMTFSDWVFKASLIMTADYLSRSLSLFLTQYF